MCPHVVKKQEHTRAHSMIFHSYLDLIIFS